MLGLVEAGDLEEASFVFVGAAEAAPQLAESNALAAYQFNPAGLQTYNSALVSADVAFLTAVNTAASANGISPTAALSGPVLTTWPRLESDPCRRACRTGLA